MFTLPEDNPNALDVDIVSAGYGNKKVLDGVTLQVGGGEVVAVVGHNGAGKSTLFKAVFGLIPLWAGSVKYYGRVLYRPTPRDLIRSGLAYVPQGNRVFGDLTVIDNFRMAVAGCDDSAQLDNGIERSLTAFPDLRSRLQQRAATLSGGEKQMLALGIALVSSPRLLLLDEPSLGLAPQSVKRVLDMIRQLNHESGIAVLIIEQKVRDVLKIADRAYVLRNGAVALSGCAADLDDESLRNAYF